MTYIVAGPTIVNDIHEYHGSTRQQVLGGSVYCVSGLLIWTADVLYVSIVGPDFDEYFGKWMKLNQVPRTGLLYNLPHTHYTQLVYDKDGKYRETSIHGPDYEEVAYAASRLHSVDIAQHCTPSTKGIYMEVNEDEDIWANLSDIRRRTRAPVLWEIPTSSVVTAAKRELTLQNISLTDMFSINIPEGEMLFQTQNRDTLFDHIRSTQVPCFLRAGEEGSYWLCNQGVFFSPSVLIATPVDPTGCGNASTAGALFAFAENCPPEAIPAIANISAAFTISQYGPYPHVCSADRILAKQILQKILLCSH